jgi:hypothetical protein
MKKPRIEKLVPIVTILVIVVLSLFAPQHDVEAEMTKLLVGTDPSLYWEINKIGKFLSSYEMYEVVGKVHAGAENRQMLCLIIFRTSGASPALIEFQCN